MKFEHVCALLRRHFDAALGPELLPGQFRHQPPVIARAWQALVERRQTGVVLADEVGLGKTYEALWTAYLYLLHKLKEESGSSPARILIVVPPSLTEKWREEVERFADQVEMIESSEGWDRQRRSDWLDRIDELTDEGGRLSLRMLKQPFSDRTGGVFLLRPNMLTRLVPEDSTTGHGATSEAVRRFRQVDWDVIVFDEAHQYAKSSKRARAAQSLCGWAHERDTRILLCTATPFQLDTGELNDLLALVEPCDDRRTQIRRAIEHYNLSIVALREALDRGLSHHLEQRRQQARDSQQHLETLLRHYMLRSSRDGHDSRAYDATAVPPGDRFPWLYWQVRDWTRALTRDGSRRSFISTTLGMTMSSNRSLAAHLDNSKASQHSVGMQAVSAVQQPGATHPKFDYLERLIGDMLAGATNIVVSTAANAEVVAEHKCVVFVSYTGTMDAIRHSLTVRSAADQVDECVSQALRARLVEANVTEQQVKRRLARAVDKAADVIVTRYPLAPHDPVSIWSTPYDAQTGDERWEELQIRRGIKEDLSQREADSPAQSLAGTLKRHLSGKLGEAVWLYRLVLDALSAGKAWQDELDRVVLRAVESRLDEALSRIAKHYYQGHDTPIQTRTWLRMRLSRLAYALLPRAAIEYLSGEVDFATRQQIINAFNRELYPLVLVCSSVGEEGIDLQKQCNRVIHYDLEWNPARVEQREGRVDRRGRASTSPVRVQTLKLADTYDERILKRCENRAIWMELFLCKSWKDEADRAESDAVDASKVSLTGSNALAWLRDYRLDLRPTPIE